MLKNISFNVKQQSNNALLLSGVFKDDTGTSNIVTRISGWEDLTSVEVKTEPKLNSIGTYVVSTEVPEREVRVTFNMVSGGKQAHRSFRNIAIAGTPVKLEWVSSINGNSVTEYIESARILGSTLNQTDQNSELTVVALCVNPEIKTL